MAAWIALLLLVIAGLALLLRADTGTIAGFEPSDFAIVVGSVALLTLHRLGRRRKLSRPGRSGRARLAGLGRWWLSPSLPDTASARTC